MKKRILIIGVNSFIGNNLYPVFKKKFNVKKINYSEFLLIDKKNLTNFSYIVNCASNKRYVYSKYSKKNDFDIEIAKRIKDHKCKLIFLSTRKVYRPGNNIKENSKLKPNCNYSINKLITESIIKKYYKKEF